MVDESMCGGGCCPMECPQCKGEMEELETVITNKQTQAEIQRASAWVCHPCNLAIQQFPQAPPGTIPPGFPRATQRVEDIDELTGLPLDTPEFRQQVQARKEAGGSSRLILVLCVTDGEVKTPVLAAWDPKKLHKAFEQFQEDHPLTRLQQVSAITVVE